MSKNKNTIKVAALASGAVIMSAFGSTEVNATTLLDFETLGTGAELRTNLITTSAVNMIHSNTNIELECGEGKCGEGKCGEGKCGESSGESTEKKSDDKSVKAAQPVAAPTKTATKTATKAPTSTKSTGEKTNTEKKTESSNPN